MFREEYWGRGFATEFGQSMIRVNFRELEIDRVFATAAHANVASIRVMEKLGMQPVRSNERGVEYEVTRPS
jgi:[ribosomal protein S5]-alanine N-acetyltransferase